MTWYKIPLEGIHIHLRIHTGANEKSGYFLNVIYLRSSLSKDFFIFLSVNCHEGLGTNKGVVFPLPYP